MKFWQLTSLLREDPSVIGTVASRSSDWRHFGQWLLARNELIDAQDRQKLDFKLPDDFVRAVLSEVDMPFFVDREGWLRLGSVGAGNERMSAVEAFTRYGGEVLEEALEKGVSKV